MRSPPAQRILGTLAAEYLRFVWYTNRLVVEPHDLYDWVEPHLPVVIAMWHGQHFMVPFLSRGHRAKVLISRHRDGEVNAYAAWRGKAQQTVDNAQMRYFIVHVHRLLDPDATPQAGH